MTKSASTFFLLSGIFIAVLSSCTSQEDPALTFSIPPTGFEVVQQLPEDQRAGSGNPLYLPPREVTSEEFGSPALQLFVDSMYRVMRRTAGVGIAANQLGKRLQIFMLEAEASNPRYKVLGPVPKQVFVNPRITAVSSERRNFWHGCLSAKGLDRGNVATHAWIEYACQDLDGTSRTGRLEGFAAVIFQHEFRHMLGGTYLDHANHRVPKPELDTLIASGVLPFFEACADSVPLLVAGYHVGESLTAYHQRLGTER